MYVYTEREREGVSERRQRKRDRAVGGGREDAFGTHLCVWGERERERRGEKEDRGRESAVGGGHEEALAT